MSDPTRHLYPTERLNALSDGVIAVALTLLVVNLEFPKLPPDTTSGALWDALLDHLPHIELWVVSFFIIGVLWLIQHDVHGRQEHVDGPAVLFGLAYLASVSLLPFSIGIVAQHRSNPVSLAWFWGNVLVVGLAMSLQLYFIVRLPAEARHPALRDDAIRRKLVLLVLAVPLAAAVGIAAAPIHPHVSLWSGVPIIAASLATLRWSVAKTRASLVAVE
ncbi:MAG: TMEM175 family protein [Polyangiales bacterium]|nr:DUF1211 domain-containing protein [Myxococcales bacterium]MCB9656915.1 DUF1211 domain-containing protein [Sandaracinaceae bacterium]